MIANAEDHVTTQIERTKHPTDYRETTPPFTRNAEEACEGWLKNRVRLNREAVRKHWGSLGEWLRRPPRTIRYMGREDLATLRAEIVEGLLAQGATLERAHELTAGLPVVGDLLDSRGQSE